MASPKRQEKVYKEQDRILLALKKIRPFPFVLSGGTALSRFYFHHRFSEDLDFFCEEMDFSFEKVEKMAALLRMSGIPCELVTQSEKPGHLKAAIYNAGDPIQIKIDFLEDPFTGMWNPITRKTESEIAFRVDALDQIYYRKLFALIEQWHKTRRISRTKDLVDLYAFFRYHRNLEKTLAYYRENHVPIPEEKLIMILGSLNKKNLIEGGKKILRLTGFGLDEVYDGLKKAGEELLRKGLG